MKSKRKSRIWGQRRTAHRSKDGSWEGAFIEKCDRVCDKADAKLRKRVKVYVSDKHTQKFLEKLVDPRSLGR